MWHKLFVFQESLVVYPARAKYGSMRIRMRLWHSSLVHSTQNIFLVNCSSQLNIQRTLMNVLQSWVSVDRWWIRAEFPWVCQVCADWRELAANDSLSGKQSNIFLWNKQFSFSTVKLEKAKNANKDEDLNNQIKSSMLRKPIFEWFLIPIFSDW